MSKDVAKKLKDIKVLRPYDQQLVSLADMWKDGPVLLIMFRRWGCSLCRMSAVNISQLKPLLDTVGVRLVGVGVEQLGFQDFTNKGYFNGELYIDEGKTAYKALSCETFTWKMLFSLLMGALKDLVNITKEKGYEHNMQGEKFQLGGTFLIDKGGVELYSHYQTKLGFEPDIPKIIEALKVQLPEDYEPYPTFSQRPGANGGLVGKRVN